MRLIHLLVVLLAAASGCSPASEQEAQAEFESFVSGHNKCQHDDDCATFFPGCPLGCYAAVHVNAVRGAKDLAKELIADYESAGRACFYQCVAECGVRCVNNACTTIVDCAP
jgi:hypothetical protein